MTKYVQFQAGSGEYAVAAERVLQIRSGKDIVAMPSPAPHISGLIPFGTQALTVIGAFGDSGDHVLIVDSDTGPFGVLVQEVTGVVEIAPESISGRPRGQGNDLISGVIAQAEGMTMLVDLEAMAKMLAS